MTGVGLQSQLFTLLSWPEWFSSGLDKTCESALAFSLLFAALPVLPGRTTPVSSYRTPLIEQAIT